jgi:hypothetical protein
MYAVIPLLACISPPPKKTPVLNANLVPLGRLQADRPALNNTPTEPILMISLKPSGRSAAW